MMKQSLRLYKRSTLHISISTTELKRDRDNENVSNEYYIENPFTIIKNNKEANVISCSCLESLKYFLVIFREGILISGEKIGNETYNNT